MSVNTLYINELEILEFSRKKLRIELKTGENLHKYVLSKFLIDSYPVDKKKPSLLVKLFSGISKTAVYNLHRSNYEIPEKLKAEYTKKYNKRQTANIVNTKDKVVGKLVFTFKELNKDDKGKEVVKIDKIKQKRDELLHDNKSRYIEPKNLEEREELANRICRLIATGLMSAQIACERCNVDISLFMEWVNTDDAIMQQYQESMAVAQMLDEGDMIVQLRKLINERLKKGYTRTTEITYEKIEVIQEDGTIKTKWEEKYKKEKKSGIPVKDMTAMLQLIQSYGVSNIVEAPEKDDVEGMDLDYLQEALNKIKKENQAIKKKKI